MDVALGLLSKDGSGSKERVTGWFDLPDADLCRRLMDRMQEMQSFWSAERKRQVECWAFHDGEHWPKEAKERARAEKRPLLTLNYLDSMVRAVVGEERLNRQEIRIYGRASGGESDDKGFGMTQLIRWVMNGQDGDMAISEAFHGGVACGEGWVVPEVSFDDDPEGMIVVQWVDEQEILPDPESVKADHSDGRKLVRFRRMTSDDLEAEWPGTLAKLEEWSIGHIGTSYRSTDGSGARDIYWSQSDTLSPHVYCGKTGTWLVCEHWWAERQQGWVAIDPLNGSVVELTDKEKKALDLEYKALVEEALATGGPMPEPPPEAARRAITRFYQAFTVGNVVLEKMPHPVPEARRIPYVRFAGIRKKKEKGWRGLIDGLKDAQRQINIESSSIVYQIQKMAKGGWIAPRGAYVDKEKWQTQAAQPGVLLEYDPRKGKPDTMDGQSPPRHLIELVQTRMAAIRDISGVNIEMQGIRQGQDPGVVLQLRKQAAMTTLAVFFDHARLGRRALAKVLIPYIQKFIAPERQIAVLGPDGGARYVVMDDNMRLARYEAAIDDVTASPNDRSETLTVLQTLLPVMLKAGVPVPPQMVDIIPMPPHVREAFKAMMEQQMGMSPQAAAPPGDTMQAETING